MSRSDRFVSQTTLMSFFKPYRRFTMGNDSQMYIYKDKDESKWILKEINGTVCKLSPISDIRLSYLETVYGWSEVGEKNLRKEIEKESEDSGNE